MKNFVKDGVTLWGPALAGGAVLRRGIPACAMNRRPPSFSAPARFLVLAQPFLH